MHSENMIQLSGPFPVADSLGRLWELNGIRIFDEGYGIIDVYVDFANSMDDEPLYADAVVIRQILAKLRELGYRGPDFGPGDPGMQDDKLIVLEAPEAFGDFAASKGWKNLAAAYADDQAAFSLADDPLADAAASSIYAALMRKLRVIE